MKDLHDLLEDYPADVAIYCVASMLSKLIVNTAEDRDDAARLVALAGEQVSDAVAIDFDVFDAVRGMVKGMD
jgi:hypothetical protein